MDSPIEVYVYVFRKPDATYQMYVTLEMDEEPPKPLKFWSGKCHRWEFTPPVNPGFSPVHLNVAAEAVKRPDLVQQINLIASGNAAKLILEKSGSKVEPTLP